MRFVLVAVAAMLVITAVASPRPLQDPPGVPTPTPTPLTPPPVTPTPAPTPLPAGSPPDFAEVAWPPAPSRALGKPFSHGRLVGGVQLPELGEDFFTWDPVFNRMPNRDWRRWGTDRLIRTVLTVIHDYRTEHDGAPRIGIGDLSRPHGGAFGKRYGGLGHASHQNGLDVDVLYPRKDGLERRPYKPSQVDRRAAQELVDRFVAAGAQKVFVGPRLHLRGPRNVVIALVHHDDHLHVRIRNVRR